MPRRDTTRRRKRYSAAIYSSTRLQFRSETKGGTTVLPPPPHPFAHLPSLAFATSFRRCPLLNYCETIVFSYGRPTRSGRLDAFARLSSASGEYLPYVYIEYGCARARARACVLVGALDGSGRNARREFAAIRCRILLASLAARARSPRKRRAVGRAFFTPFF